MSSTDSASTASSPPALTGTVERLRTGSAVMREWSGRTIMTGARKTERTDPVALDRFGLDGDEQGNTAVHGGREKAVCCYPAEFYPLWAADGIEISEDGFFENLTLRGLPDELVHLGDIFELGTARVQVTQPRRPCTTLSARWSLADLPLLMQSTGRCGYYLRVLTPGRIRQGDTMTLIERLPGSVSVAEVNRVMNVDRFDAAGIQSLLASPELPERWRTNLERRLARGVAEDDSARTGQSPADIP